MFVACKYLVILLIKVFNLSEKSESTVANVILWRDVVCKGVPDVPERTNVGHEYVVNDNYHRMCLVMRARETVDGEVMLLCIIPQAYNVAVEHGLVS